MVEELHDGDAHRCNTRDLLGGAQLGVGLGMDGVV